MGFVSKGSKIVVKPGSDSVNGSYLFKALEQDGTFSDKSWGTTIDDFDSAIVSSTWTTYGAYQYINLGLVRQVYSDVHSFNRNTRFDSCIRLSNTVVPTSANTDSVFYLTAVVKGSLTDSASTISQRVIDEFSADTYEYVLAIGKMNRSIDDYRAINIDVNNIKTFKGTAESKKDYDLSTNEAIYLVNLAVCTNADMEQFTSLSINLYKEYFIEFLGDNCITPGSIGKTEINPDYKAEKAINTYLMVIDEAHIVDGKIIISPDYTTEIIDGTMYFLRFTVNSVSATKLSLGYYDLETEAYVPVGTEYNLTISGTVANKVCAAVVTGDSIIIKALV